MERNVFQVMKSKVLSLEEHVACAVQMGKARSLFLWKSEGKRSLWRPVADRVIILKWIFTKCNLTIQFWHCRKTRLPWSSRESYGTFSVVVVPLASQDRTPFIWSLMVFWFLCVTSVSRFEKSRFYRCNFLVLRRSQACLYIVKLKPTECHVQQFNCPYIISDVSVHWFSNYRH